MSATPSPTVTRPEIQGLRALAVALVLAFHFWPARMPGGYIGVDVFFVVSGFLITSHLLREVTATGRLSLAQFWARRARRLLPASLLVLASVAIASFFVIPRGLWERFFSEIVASALYFENWLLAANSVDYLAATNSASPVQHFWTLSAEEQFYVIWPVLIVLALLFTRKASARRQRATVFVVLAAVTLASFVTSLVFTAHLQSAAYFITPTRAWEFGIGALLAFAPTLKAGRLGFIAAWVGVVAIAGSALAFDAQTQFPGVAAIVPTLGALAVIWGASSASPWSIPGLSTWRPIQYVGDISYSLYLWHWPLIILLPFVTLQPLGNREKVILLAVTFVLAGLTKVFVEDPVRRARVLTQRRPRWSLLAALAAMVLVSAVSVSAITAGHALTNPAPPAAAAGPQCFAAAATSTDDCPDLLPADWAVATAFARTDRIDEGTPAVEGRCQTDAWTTNINECSIGNYSDPVKTVALIGDSHANAYDGALAQMAEDLHWNVRVFVRSACVGLGDPEVYFVHRPWDAVACAAWGRKVASEVAADPAIDTVFMTSYAGVYLTGDAARPVGTEPFISLWKHFISAGKKIVVLSDSPRPIGNVPDCLEAQKAVAPCSVSADTAFVQDSMKDAALEMGSPLVNYVDLDDRFCIDGTCPPMIGGVIVYTDDSHLTKTYSRSLAPFIEDALGLTQR